MSPIVKCDKRLHVTKHEEEKNIFSHKIEMSTNKINSIMWNARKCKKSLLLKVNNSNCHMMWNVRKWEISQTLKSKKN